MLNYLKRSFQFRLQLSELGIQDRLLRIHHHIHRQIRLHCQANGLAQPALYAVPLDRAAKNFPYREANAQALRSFLALAMQIKHSHVRRKMSPSLLINSLEIRMPQ